MKKTFALAVIGIVAVGLVVFALTRRQGRQAQTESAAHSADHASAPSWSPEVKRIPAHFETEPPRSSLAPTLEPDKFSGKARDAYRVVREAPQLIAQLPCYCYCDRGFGHKSLHSCFVDDHAAQCAVCVDEALEAYNLHKLGLSAEQIRERIVARFGT